MSSSRGVVTAQSDRHSQVVIGTAMRPLVDESNQIVKTVRECLCCVRL